ncbi:MAG: prefoldin subunit alpha [Candidatus Hydrothermarchaeota archaeon]|nr:prefoldin subunit alpha [Candidatus Hydrothermarchaeota archaeon]
MSADAKKVMSEYEYLRNQAEALQKNLEMINASLTEIDAVLETLDEIKEQGKKNEILMPIGADSFVSARVIDTKKVIVGLGADVAVKKSIPGARKDLEARFKELEGVRGEISEKLGTLMNRIEELSPQVQRIVAGARGEG